MLKDALDEVLGGPRVLVRPLADRDGFAVVHEERCRRNRYAATLVARVASPTRTSIVYPWDNDRASMVGPPSASTGPNPRSPTLRMPGEDRRILGWDPITADRGGLLDARTQIGRVVGGRPSGRVCGRRAASAVYLLRHRMDADAVRAVRDAVVAEVQGEAARIRDEVQTGDLGGRALETRKSRLPTCG